MKVLVTGATGFIGNYVVEGLLSREHHVIATSNNILKAKKAKWFNNVTYIQNDIYTETTEDLFKKFQKPDFTIHLAWNYLNEFKSQDHINIELPAHTSFLENLIKNGLNNLTCIGTCLEYGLQEGELSEELESKPTIAYSIAKDALRKKVELLQQKHSFSFKWLRLFYMYGKGQSPKSILSQLENTLENNELEFKMSKGEQVRDYLPVEDVAENIISIALQRKIIGIINCCSNKPVTVIQLVETYLNINNKHINLNTGFYPYNDYEPFKFWGDNTKFLKLRT